MAPTGASSGAAPGQGCVERTARLDVWRDIVREHFVALDIDADRSERFAGSVRSTRIGHLDVATVDSTAQVCRRTSGLARRDGQAYFQVGLLTRRGAMLSRHGRQASLEPGCFAVYATDRPFLWALDGS